MLISMKRNGFTIVELIVVISIMGILLILGVVNLTGSQVSARDSERKTDIENIAVHLESYYISNSNPDSESGSYPTTTMMNSLDAQQLILPDIDIKSLVAPGAPSSSITSLVTATNNIQTIAGVLPQPQSSSSQNQYVYQPLMQNDTLCTNYGCQKFNLYYKTEADGVIHIITSKNQ